MGKSVWIDLNEHDPARAKEQARQHIPAWEQLHFDTSAKYLGFYLGPGRGNRSWDKPLKKYEDRAGYWGRAGGGLHATAVAYSIYILPVLSFVAQLEDPPDNWEEIESRCFRKLIPSPGNGCMPLLAPLLELTGMPKSFASLRHMAKAAKLRVATREAAKAGGLHVEQRSRALQDRERLTSHVVRAARWADWLHSCFLHRIAKAVAELRACGITEQSLVDEAVGAPPWSPAQARRAARCIQRTAVAAQARLQNGQAECHRLLRRAADRWRMRVLPGLRVERFLSTTRWLRTRTQPRVVAAMLRTMTNCWITGRRMQQRGGRCMMGCDAEDAIEHYATCRHIQHFGQAELWLDPLPVEDRLPGFLGVLHGRPADHHKEVLRRALLTTAAYKLHGWWRHHRGPPLGQAAMLKALRVQLREILAADVAEEPLAANSGGD